MSKRILWTGSLSYEVLGVKLIKNQECTVPDNVCGLLPIGSFKVLEDTKTPEATKTPTAPKVVIPAKTVKPEVVEEMSESQKMFYTANNIASLKLKALNVGIELSDTSSKEIMFKEMLEKGFKIG